MLIFIDNLITLFKVFFVVSFVITIFYILWNRYCRHWFLLKKGKHIVPALILATLIPMFFLYDTKMPGYRDLEMACKNLASYSLGDPVYVNGYYHDGNSCGHCWQTEILEKGADYMEIKVDNVESNREYPEPGIWRVEKKSRNSGDCSKSLEKSVSKLYKRNPFWKDYCVSLEKSNNPESRYGYFYSVDKKILDNKYQSVLKNIEEKVVDIKNKKVISRANRFDLLPYKNHGLHYAFTLRCDSLSVSETEKQKYRFGVLNKTIVIGSGD